MRYEGPAAPGAHSAATVEPTDVLDLVETDLWPGGKRMRKDIGLIGPALGAFFACCGGTPVEVEKAKRRDFRPNDSDRLLLRGSDWKLPRTVPLFELARSKL